MKLQKFIENYQKSHLDTPNSRSADRLYVFKTSESIGTLNSNDQYATDRSFVVKEQSAHNDNNHQNSQSIQHLRQLCEIQKDLQRSDTLEMRNQEIDMHRWVQSYQSPTFSKTLNSSHSFVKNRSKGILQPQDGQISFSVGPENLDFLYQQAPSELYEGCPTEETVVLKNQQQWFLMHYGHLIQKISSLQQQNNSIKAQLTSAQQLGSFLSKKEEILTSQLSTLKDQVSQTMQSNIQLENKIKEMLLKHQMQRYNISSRDKNVTSILGSCNSEKQLPLRFIREKY